MINNSKTDTEKFCPCWDCLGSWRDRIADFNFFVCRCGHRGVVSELISSDQRQSILEEIENSQ